MKKAISILLALVMTLSLALPAFAYDDKVFAESETLPGQMGFDYDSVTVKSGVTVTFRDLGSDPQTLWIHKSLAVEDGAGFAGPGSIAFVGDASFSGIDLYYTVGGAEKLLDPVNLAALIKDDPENRSIFNYSRETGHFVLSGYDFEVDPFEVPAHADGGSSGFFDPTVLFAEGLKTLGIFNGVGNNPDGTVNFDLNRAPTREEAVVLLIRLLGKDAEAKGYPAEKCPFTDVSDWAKSYLAYAYDNGITNGIGGGLFGVGEATVEQFQTFVLRAMGYSDKDGLDFTWDHPEKLAEKLGIVLSENDKANFTRGVCVRIMEIALRNAMKTGERLADKLIEQGVFTKDAFEAAFSGLDKEDE